MIVTVYPRCPLLESFAEQTSPSYLFRQNIIETTKTRVPITDTTTDKINFQCGKPSAEDCLEEPDVLGLAAKSRPTNKFGIQSYSF